MDAHNRIAAQLRANNVFASNGGSGGKAMPLAESGRVVALAGITEMPADQLRRVGTVCVRRDDPIAPELTRGQA
ncbi:MAG: hypothetical protein WD382_01375 [Halofilum sp. (in: g-proteobacteria)]